MRNDCLWMYRKYTGSATRKSVRSANMHIRKGRIRKRDQTVGSGKSTLMNIIGCLDLADEGEYLLDGQEIENYSERELAKIRNKRLASFSRI